MKVVDSAHETLVRLLTEPILRHNFTGRAEGKYDQRAKSDITGAGGVEPWTKLEKITTKWAPVPNGSWMG